MNKMISQFTIMTLELETYCCYLSAVG